jgi:CRP/FNR family transcriptional regulator
MPETSIDPTGVEILAAVPYLSELDVETRQAVARSALRRRYGADEVVLFEGEASAGLYVVETGWLKSLKMSTAGREQVVRFIGPGETFNELGALADVPNQVTVVALEPAAVWLVPGGVMHDLLETYPGLARAVIRHLARRVLHLMGLVEDLSLRTVEARVARLILDEASGNVMHRRRWATQTEMAARLGTVPDVLNRALRKLTEDGLIEVERHEIRILAPEGLGARAMLVE